MSYYHAEVVNLSLKNVDIINNYKTICQPSAFHVFGDL